MSCKIDHAPQVCHARMVILPTHVYLSIIKVGNPPTPVCVTSFMNVPLFGCQTRKISLGHDKNWLDFTFLCFLFLTSDGLFSFSF